MTGRVHYFSFYLGPGQEGRQSVPAGFAKVEYVAQVAAGAGLDVRLVSTAISSGGYVRGMRDGRLLYLPSWRPSGRVGFAVARLVLWVQIVRYLLFEVRRDDTVLAYHSLDYLPPFKIARRVKRFRLVVEFNDLYSAVAPQHAGKREGEEEFIRSADGHLFMNRIAAARFSDGQPHAISYGSYAEPERRAARRDDGHVHVVYAGVIEARRRAAMLAVAAAAHLDDRFVVHILGYGLPVDIEALRAQVVEVNARAGREAAVYHGEMRGLAFSDFLHGCHIGLSTHAYTQEEQESADFTFPSKIPVYASHGLTIVSPSIPCVTDSPFAEIASFYARHAPEEIAAALNEAVAHREEAQSVSLTRRLDHEFRRALPLVMSGPQAGPTQVGCTA